MWVETSGNDLAAGSSEDTLLALLPNLIEDDTGWQDVSDTIGSGSMP